MVFDFHAVRTDVLHGACTDAAWNEGQIFQPPPTLVQGLHDKVVPHLPCAYRNANVPAIVGHHLQATDLDLDHERLDVAVKEHVAPPTEHEHLEVALLCPIQGLPQCFDRRHFGKPLCLGRDAKCRVVGQFHIRLHVKGLGRHVARFTIPYGEKHGAVDSFPRPIVGNHVEDALTLRPGLGYDVVACNLGSHLGALPKTIRTLNGIHVLGSCQLEVHRILHVTKLLQFCTSIVVDMKASHNTNADNSAPKHLAEQAMKNGDWSQALAAWKTWWKASSELARLDPDAMHDRAVCHFHCGEKHAALAWLNQAADTQPDYSYRYSSRGLMKQASGDTHGAIEDYKKALELDPEDAVGLRDVALPWVKGNRCNTAPPPS